MRVAGIVLAGGQSSRMGQTKSVIEVDGRAMADRVLDVLREIGAEPAVIVGGNAPELEALSAPVLPDLEPGEGPVGGVLSALTHAAQWPNVDAAFVLACDLPWMSAATLTMLLDAFQERPDADVWVGEGDRLEPLCACWSTTPATLLRVRSSFDAGERAMHRMIGQLDHHVINLPDAQPDLRNVNRPEDLPPGSGR